MAQVGCAHGANSDNDDDSSNIVARLPHRAVRPDTSGDSVGADARSHAHSEPRLRDIAVTAAYMHDVSVATLEDVLDHYAAGARTFTDGPHRGIGRDSLEQDGRDALVHAHAGATRRPESLPAIAHGRAAVERPAIRRPMAVTYETRDTPGRHGRHREPAGAGAVVPAKLRQALERTRPDA